MRKQTGTAGAKTKAVHQPQLSNSLDQILNGMADGFVTLDRQWRFTHVNTAAACYIGKPSERLIGKSLRECIPGIANTPAERHLRHAMEQQTPVQFEEHDPTSKVWYELRCVPTPDGLAVFSKDITESKLAREALRQSEARFRLLAEMVPEMLFSDSPDGFNDYCSQRFYEYTGAKRKTSDGHNWLNFVHPDDLEATRSSWVRGIAQGIPCEVMCRIRGASGGYRWFVARARPVLDNLGNIAKWFGAATDVDELVRAQQASREYRDQLDQALDCARMGTFSIDCDTGSAVWSSQLFSLLGYLPDEVTPSREAWIQRLHPDDAARVEAAFTAAVETHKDCQDEYRVCWPDGSVHWLHMSGRCASDVRTRKSRMVGVLQDITSEKEAAQALGARERRFRVLTEKSGDPIAILDPSGNILYETPGGISLGYTAGMNTGRNVFELVHPDDVARVQQVFAELVAARGASREVELRLRALDGSWRILQSIGTNLIDDPDIGGIVINSRDVTERRHAEDALRQAHDQLEERVRCRTSALQTTNCALREAEERFRQMAENMEEVFWLLDARKMRTLYISPAFETIWGRTRESVYKDPLSWLSAIHPDDRPQVDRYLAQKDLRTGFSGEYRVVRPDGSVRWVWDRAVPLLDEKGDLLRIICVARDVTERKALEHEIVVSAERQQQSIGQEIHDSLCQQLAGIGFLADCLVERLASGDRAAADKDATLIANLVKDAMAHSRHLARGLFPVELDVDGLMTALDELVKKTTLLFRVACRFDCKWDVQVRDAATATQLYRIAQEAMHNASRHSKADKIAVALKKAKGRLTLTIRDNGRGFDANTASGGIGLRCMQYRAKLIGAKLDIVSSRRGTVVQCSLANE